MSTRSSVPSEFDDASFDGFAALEMEFDSGTIRLWHGTRDLVVDGQTYSGAGDFLSFDPIKEDGIISAHSVTVNLSGVDPTILSYVFAEQYQYRPATIYVGSLVAGVASEYKAYKGIMDVMTTKSDGGAASITLNLEHRLRRLDNTSERRNTSEDQKSLHSGDLGFDFVNSLQEAEISWRD